MKIVKIGESEKDSQEIARLIKERDQYQNVVNMYTTKIRELVYKYDTAKMDFNRKTNS